MKKGWWERVNFNSVASICEALILVSLTLLLCLLYLRIGRDSSEVSPWLIACVVTLPVAFIVAVAASYIAGERSSVEAGSASFRVNRQLIETLAAEHVPKDVLKGLTKLCGDKDKVIVGEYYFLTLLEATFGDERARDVKQAVFKYAKVSRLPQSDTREELK